MATETQGARRLREDLQELIQANHAQALTVARPLWGWTEKSMPALRFVDAYETEIIDDPPQLAVNVGEMTRLTNPDLDPTSGREVFEASYNVALYLWVKSTEPRVTLALRDDYIAVIRSVVLSRQGINNGADYRVNQTTLKESYSDLSRAKGDRWLAAGRVTFTLAREETLWRAEGWYVDTAEVEASLLPRTSS